jgi:flagellin
MSGAIALSNGLRNSLNALGSLDADITKTNNRLATGKKVASALDNASIFFQARGFQNKAGSLASIQDGLTTGLKTLEAAGKALEAIDKTLGSIKGLLQQATTLTGTAQTDVIAQANALRTKLDDFVKDAGFNGTNLLNGTGAGFDLKVTFDAETPTSSTTTGVDFKIAAAGGLNLATAFTAAALPANITSVDTAVAATRSRASIISTDASLVQIRQSFTKDRISILGAASDALTNADLNEEGANLSALQTRQQLAVTALSLANRSDQAILRLF